MLDRPLGASRVPTAGETAIQVAGSGVSRGQSTNFCLKCVTAFLSAGGPTWKGEEISFLL